MDHHSDDGPRHRVLEFRNGRAKAYARNLTLFDEKAVIGVSARLNDVIAQAGNVAALCDDLGRVSSVRPIRPDPRAGSIPQGLERGVEDGRLEGVAGGLVEVEFVTPRRIGQRVATTFPCRSAPLPSVQSRLSHALQFALRNAPQFRFSECPHVQSLRAGGHRQRPGFPNFSGGVPRAVRFTLAGHPARGP